TEPGRLRLLRFPRADAGAAAGIRHQPSDSVRPFRLSLKLMFGFRKSTKDPFADKRAVERWVASFPANDPLGTHAALLTELGALADRQATRTPARLESLFHLDALSDRLRRSLTAQYL